MSFRNKIRAGSNQLTSIFRWYVNSFQKSSEKASKLLMIYDLNSQPLSIGDILIMQEASLVLQRQHSIEKIDFAIYFRPDQSIHPEKSFQHINQDNIFTHISEIIQTVQVNPYLGSVLLFGDRAQLEHYIQTNLEQYIIWPNVNLYMSGEYLYYPALNDLLYLHFLKYQSLPTLHCRKSVLDWAKYFIHQHTNNKLVVTIQLRNNPRTPKRNTDIDCWLKLFEYCYDKNYSVSFIIICAKDEIDPRIRDCPNTLLAKDYCTNVEQDLALVELSDIHMGASSGPSTIAFFSNKPYCLFKWDGIERLYKNLIYKNNSYYFYFANDAQKLIKKDETPELLINEFTNLWEYLKNRSV